MLKAGIWPYRFASAHNFAWGAILLRVQCPAQVAASFSSCNSWILECGVRSSVKFQRSFSPGISD